MAGVNVLPTVSLIRVIDLRSLSHASAFNLVSCFKRTH